MAGPSSRASRANSGLAEMQVMDLYEAGRTDHQIAASLGKPLSVVRRILTYMGAHEAPIFHRTAMEAGSRQLAAAVLSARAA